MLSLVVMCRRSWMCLMGLVGAAACRQPNPEWLGPRGETLAASSDGGETSTGESGTTAAESTTTAPSTNGEPTTSTTSDDGPIPSQCAPAPIPGQGECPATCSACDGGRCIVDCSVIDCSNAIVTCPEGWPCDFLCIGDAVCKRGKLGCAPDRDCTVDCEGFEACQRAEVTCGAGTCAVTCGPEQSTCRLLAVACGPTDASVTCQSPSNLDLQPSGSACACEDYGCEG